MIDYKDITDVLIEIPYKFNYVLITVVVIYISDYISEYLSNENRLKLAANQRDAYFKRLTIQSLKMESEALDKELETVENIRRLKEEGHKMMSQLQEYDPIRYSKDRDDSDSNSDSSDDYDQIRQQLEDKLSSLQAKAKELDSLNQEIKIITEEIDPQVVRLSDGLSPLDLTKIKRKIEMLEEENESLKRQLELTNQNGVQINTKLHDYDNEFVKYVEENEEFTFSYLEKAYESILELKDANPSLDLNSYATKLKKVRPNYETKLADLSVRKKGAEIKLKETKSFYNDEMNTFEECRVEHILKLAGALEYLTALKEKNRINGKLLENLKDEMNYKKQELETWKNKYEEAEAQCNRYLKARKDIQVKAEQLESQRRAQQKIDDKASVEQYLNSIQIEHFDPPQM